MQLISHGASSKAAGHQALENTGSFVPAFGEAVGPPGHIQAVAMEGQWPRRPLHKVSDHQRVEHVETCAF